MSSFGVDGTTNDITFSGNKYTVTIKSTHGDIPANLLDGSCFIDSYIRPAEGEVFPIGAKVKLAEYKIGNTDHTPSGNTTITIDASTQHGFHGVLLWYASAPSNAKHTALNVGHNNKTETFKMEIVPPTTSGSSPAAFSENKTVIIESRIYGSENINAKAVKTIGTTQVTLKKN